MLYLIGLGLHDIKDISVKGLEIVRNCDRIFLDRYTSILGIHSVEALEKFLEKRVEEAHREIVEDDNNVIIQAARVGNTAFLVVGDPLAATTHSDLMLRALDEGIPYSVVHNASIMGAIGCTGLQMYRFGETVSLCFWDEYVRPESYMDRIEANFSRGLHTLCLLDIKVREPTVRSLLTGKPEYQPPRFMSCRTAAAQLIDISQLRLERGEKCCINDSCLVVGMARVGAEDQCVRAMNMKDMAGDDGALMGDPLHTMIVPGVLHPMEIEFLKHFMNKNVNIDAKFAAHEKLCDLARTT